MDTQTIADGTAAIISLIVLATLAALWLVSWVERCVRSRLESSAPAKISPPKNWRSAVWEPESHTDRWKRIEADVTARMQEHARQFEERLDSLGPISDADADDTPDEDGIERIDI